MGLISATIAASGQIAAAAIQAQAATTAAQISAESAKYQADKQIEANKAQQEFEKQQADLAFERNSSSGQLQQLVDAGISEAQARQIIASNGSSGEYTPAASINQMQGVDYSKIGDSYAQGVQQQGAAWSQGAAGSATSLATAANQYGDLLVRAYSSDNGDALGNFAAQKALEFFNTNVKDVDRDRVHSFVDLESWIDELDPSSEIGKKWLDWSSSDDFKELKDFSPAVSAFNANMNRIYTNNLSAGAQLSNLIQDTNCKAASESLMAAQKAVSDADLSYKQALTNATIEERENLIAQRQVLINQANVLAEQVLGERYDSLCKRLGYERVNATNDLIIEADKQRLLSETAQFMAQKDLWNDSAYRDQWFKTQMATAEGEYFMQLVVACKNRNVYNMLSNNPRFAAMVASYDAIVQAGGSSLFTSIAATVQSKLAEFVDAF